MESDLCHTLIVFNNTTVPAQPVNRLIQTRININSYINIFFLL